MRPPDETRAGIEAEIIAAERALANGNMPEARRRLADAERLGASSSDLKMLHSAIASRERFSKTDRANAKKKGKLGVWAGFGIGVMGYLILSIRQPPDWPQTLWALLAFGVVPILAGLTTGRISRAAGNARSRFWAGLKSGFISMFLYSGISLIVLRTRIASGADSMQILTVGLFVTFVYAILAGCVAGAASSKLVRGAADGGKP
jgi:hypothetical protein